MVNDMPCWTSPITWKNTHRRPSIIPQPFNTIPVIKIGGKCWVQRKRILLAKPILPEDRLPQRPPKEGAVNTRLSRNITTAIPFPNVTGS